MNKTGSSTSAEPPFNRDWLERQSLLRSSDVSQDFFNEAFQSYVINFNNTNAASNFVEALQKRGVKAILLAPKFGYFDNTVAIHKIFELELLATAQNHAQSLSENINTGLLSHPFNSGTAFSQTITESKYALEGVPFDEKWLEENYLLELSKVRKISFNKSINRLTVYFEAKSTVQKNIFLSTLTLAGCHPMVEKNAVQITYKSIEKMIENAHKARTFVSPIQSQDELEEDNALKLCITQVKAYKKILSDVRIMKSCYNEEKKLNQQKAWNTAPSGFNSLFLNTRRVESFLTIIKKNLPKLNELLNDEELKEKIEFYFLIDKSLVISFLNFISSKDFDFSGLSNALTVYDDECSLRKIV